MKKPSQSNNQAVLELHLPCKFLERFCFEREVLILKSELGMGIEST